MTTGKLLGKPDKMQPRPQDLSSSSQKHQKRDPLFSGSGAFGGKKRDPGNEVGQNAGCSL